MRVPSPANGPATYQRKPSGEQETRWKYSSELPLRIIQFVLTSCYIALHHMKNRAATKPAKSKRRRTTQVPVTTMEEIPILSARERAELLDSLEKAQARVRAGKGVDYDPATFKDRLIGIYRRGKR
jgi:hypothetical protein